MPAYAYILQSVVAVLVLVVAPLAVGALTSLFAGPPRSASPSLPNDVSLDNFRAVVLSRAPDGSLLFARQLVNSIVVSLATAALGCFLALPAAYALARFDFVGKKSGTSLLLATQMFPAVASAVPLYVLLHWLGLLDTKTGLVVCYASTAVPFAIF